MNGAHDLGGMHGFGPINAEPEAQEPVFHADWEKRVFGLVRATAPLGRWNSDMSRHARERQDPAGYLAHSYYENWLAGFLKLLVETGLVKAEELESGNSAGLAEIALRERMLKAADVADELVRGCSVAVPIEAPPRFHVGDRVRAINRHAPGHTREPRYVGGRLGVIHEHYGAHVFPDRSAEGVRLGRHLYSVCFTAAALWGENADANSKVYFDLWEDYLEPA
jgi:nitrile hydratase